MSIENNDREGAKASGKLNLSDAALQDAPDPDKALKEYKKGLVTKSDLKIETVGGKDTLKFGGDKNAVTGDDIRDLFALSSADGPLFIDISTDNGKPILAGLGSRNQYIFLEGESEGKKVRFLNGKNYTVSSATQRILDLPDSAELKTKPVAEHQDPEIVKLQEILALKKQEKEIEAKDKEQAFLVALSKFPIKIAGEFVNHGRIDILSLKGEIDGKKALKLSAFGLRPKILIPDPSRRFVAVYDGEENKFEELKPIEELNPKNQDRIKNLLS